MRPRKRVAVLAYDTYEGSMVSYVLNSRAYRAELFTDPTEVIAFVRANMLDLTPGNRVALVVGVNCSIGTEAAAAFARILVDIRQQFDGKVPVMMIDAKSAPSPDLGLPFVNGHTSMVKAMELAASLTARAPRAIHSEVA